MSSVQILLIEDDRQLSQQLSELLESKGFKVETCFDGEQGLIRAASGLHQLILLDIMLPKRDGLSLLKILRKSCQIPVIMVTAKNAEQERLQGFGHGADDYISKPFHPQELLYRVEALLRRSLPESQENTTSRLQLDELIVDANTKQVLVAGQELEITPIQFKLLWQLLLHKGEVLSKAYLYQVVLNRTIGAYDRSLDMHLSRVRRKLNDANWSGQRLETCHGKGYCLQ